VPKEREGGRSLWKGESERERHQKTRKKDGRSSQKLIKVKLDHGGRRAGEDQGGSVR